MIVEISNCRGSLIHCIRLYICTYMYKDEIKICVRSKFTQRGVGGGERKVNGRRMEQASNTCASLGIICLGISSNMYSGTGGSCNC